MKRPNELKTHQHLTWNDDWHFPQVCFISLRFRMHQRSTRKKSNVMNQKGFLPNLLTVTAESDDFGDAQNYHHCHHLRPLYRLHYDPLCTLLWSCSLLSRKYCKLAAFSTEIIFHDEPIVPGFTISKRVNTRNSGRRNLLTSNSYM